MTISTRPARHAWLALLAVLAIPANGLALEKEYVTAPTPKANDDAGWYGSLRVGANLNFMNNRKVVGQQEGSQFTLGFSFDGDIGYRKGEHDWRNGLSLLEAFGYGPPIREFVKSSDTVKFDTAYFYHPVAAPWIGPFVRAGFLTAIFEGADYRAAPTDYVVTNVTDPNTNLPQVISQKKRLRLSESFMPTTLKESAGVFLNPYRKEYLDIMILAGIGSHQVFGKNQYSLADDPATPAVIEMLRLTNFTQVGFEAGLAFTGTAYAGKIKYKAYGDVLVPFYRTDKTPGDKRTFGELTNVELGALLSFKLVDWASVDYVLKVLRQPQLIDEWQVQNLLLLTFSYSYARRQIPLPPPPPPPAAPATPPPAAAN